MSKQNLNYEDGIPEEVLWNPETNSFMKRSLFPGKWIPARISVWDADNPKYQYRPGRDRTYQEAMKSISGNSTPGDRSERQDYRDSRGNFSLSMLSEGDRTKDRPDTGNAGQSPARDAAQVPLSQDTKKNEKYYGWDVLTKSPLLSTFVVPDPPRPRSGLEYSAGEGPLGQEELERRRADKEPGGFEDQVAKVLESEGGYVNSRYDRGGATNHGISSSTWNAFAKKTYRCGTDSGKSEEAYT